MSVQIFTEKLNLATIYAFQKYGEFFSYVGDSESGIEDLYRRGQLDNRYVTIAMLNGQLAGFVIYTKFSNLKANRYITGEGDDTKLPKFYPQVLFIDIMDVTKPLQHKGVGTTLLKSLAYYNLPIMLQSTEDSEDFWYEKGFSGIDRTSWLLRS